MSSLGAEVLAFFIQDNGWCRRRESADYGAMWGMITSQFYIGAAYQDYRVAACHKANGDAIVLYSNVTTLYRSRRIGGVWESAAAWSNSLSFITGIAVVHYGDWNILVTGIDPVGNPGVWTCILGDGYALPAGTWSALKELTIASYNPERIIEFYAPSLARPDGLFRAFFVEVYFGSDYYARSYWSHTLPADAFSVNRWREPVPFNFSSYYGASLIHSGSYAWLCAPNAVWRAPLMPASIELTPDVIELHTAIKPYSGTVTVSLSNHDGRYNGSTIKPGSKVNLYLGYHTSEGLKSSLLSAFWVDGWEYITRPGSSTFVLYADDGWSLLARWRARRQYTWVATTNIFGLLRWLFARAGLAFSSYSASGAVVNQYPAFTIHPGESGLTAVKRLLDMVPDVILFVTDTAYLINPLASDAISYSYGTDHRILEGRYRTDALDVNRAQVFGSGLLTDDWLWSSIDLVYDRLHQVVDINLDTVAKAHERGLAVLRHAEIEASGGHVLVPMNCGQDLYDVISITSKQAGLEASRRRVLGLSHTWIPSRAEYALKIALGAP